MDKEQLVPLLPEVKAIIQAAFPDREIHGRLRLASTTGRHIVLLFDDEAKANNTSESKEALVAFFEGVDDKWRAFYWGICDFGQRDGQPFADYGMIPLGVETPDLIRLTELLSNHLLGID